MNKEKMHEIRKNFSWGPIVEIHTIGDYQIVEYNPEIFENCCGTGKYSDETQFHVYVNYDSAGVSYSSLDKAIIGAICVKYDGTHDADEYIFRMIF